MNTTTEKRLETMRANLEKLETRAAELLNRAETLTDAERLELLFIVNVAFHEGGKIDGVFSVDSSVLCDFCARMRKAAEGNPAHICGLCYAAADLWKEAARRRHRLNALILSTILFTPDELKRLAIPGKLCRFNEDGDTINATMGRNYIRIAQVNPGTMFGYWFKNQLAVDSALNQEHIHTRADLPENVRFIQSSIMIGEPAAPAWFADAIFTVYPDEQTTLKAIDEGAHPCNGRKCKDCKYTCYTMERHEKPVNIAEKLRTSAAKRATIIEAYNARKA